LDLFPPALLNAWRPGRFFCAASVVCSAHSSALPPACPLPILHSSGVFCLPYCRVLLLPALFFFFVVLFSCPTPFSRSAISPPSCPRSFLCCRPRPRPITSSVSPALQPGVSFSGSLHFFLFPACSEVHRGGASPRSSFPALFLRLLHWEGVIPLSRRAFSSCVSFLFGWCLLAPQLPTLRTAPRFFLPFGPLVPHFTCAPPLLCPLSNAHLVSLSCLSFVRSSPPRSFLVPPAFSCLVFLSSRAAPRVFLPPPRGSPPPSYFFPLALSVLAHAAGASHICAFPLFFFSFSDSSLAPFSPGRQLPASPLGLGPTLSRRSDCLGPSFGWALPVFRRGCLPTLMLPPGGPLCSSGFFLYVWRWWWLCALALHHVVLPSPYTFDARLGAFGSSCSLPCCLFAPPTTSRAGLHVFPSLAPSCRSFLFLIAAFPGTLFMLVPGLGSVPAPAAPLLVVVSWGSWFSCFRPSLLLSSPSFRLACRLSTLSFFSDFCTACSAVVPICRVFSAFSPPDPWLFRVWPPASLPFVFRWRAVPFLFCPRFGALSGFLYVFCPRWLFTPLWCWLSFPVARAARS